MRVSHCEKRPQLLPLRHSQQHATYLRRLHAVPPSTVWVVPFPAAGESPFRDDHGSAEPRVAAALAAFGSGQGSEHAALTALASSRLLVPIVAVAAGSDGEPQSPGHSRPDSEPQSPGHTRSDNGPQSPGHTRPGGGDSGAEMSLPTLVGRDGRRAIPAFTCSQALAMWRQQARPVPEPAAQVWRAAAEDACAVIVDVAGPVPIAIDGARLAALADGRPVPLPHQDPDVLAAVRAAGAEPARDRRAERRRRRRQRPADQRDARRRLCRGGRPGGGPPAWGRGHGQPGWPAAPGHRGRGDPRARLAGALNMAGSLVCCAG